MNNFDPVEYVVTEPMPNISLDFRQLKIGEAARLMKVMMDMDASEEELTRVDNYLKLFRSAKIENIDLKRARADLGIDALKEKFNEKRRK